jgi:hypothetical protein
VQEVVDEPGQQDAAPSSLPLLASRASSISEEVEVSQV